MDTLRINLANAADAPIRPLHAPEAYDAIQWTADSHPNAPLSCRLRAPLRRELARWLSLHHGVTGLDVLALMALHQAEFDQPLSDWICDLWLVIPFVEALGRARLCVDADTEEIREVVDQLTRKAEIRGARRHVRAALASDGSMLGGRCGAFAIDPETAREFDAPLAELKLTQQASACEPLLSVYLCAYQSEEMLGDLLDSIHSLAQDPRIEWIFVDDGSRDQTYSLMHAAALRLGNVKLVRLSANCGVAAARQAAMHVCSGRYVIAADSDDALQVDGYLALLERIESFDATSQPDLILCDFERVSGDLRKRVSPARRLASKGAGALANCAWLWNSAIRREALHERGARFCAHLQSGEDVHLLAQLFLFGDAPLFLDTLEVPVYSYRIRKGSLSHSGFLARQRKWTLESAALNRVIHYALRTRAGALDAFTQAWLLGLVERMERSWRNSAMPITSRPQIARLRDVRELIGEIATPVSTGTEAMVYLSSVMLRVKHSVRAIAR